MTDDEIVDHMFLGQTALEELLTSDSAEWAITKLVANGWAPLGLQEHVRIQKLEAELEAIAAVWEVLYVALRERAESGGLDPALCSELAVSCRESGARCRLVLDG